MCFALSSLLFPSLTLSSLPCHQILASQSHCLVSCDLLPSSRPKPLPVLLLLLLILRTFESTTPNGFLLPGFSEGLLSWLFSGTFHSLVFQEGWEHTSRFSQPSVNTLFLSPLLAPHLPSCSRFKWFPRISILCLFQPFHSLPEFNTVPSHKWHPNLHF